ncbi:MAG: ATP-binding protein, partial [Polyangiaceae bacterium]
MQPAFRGPTAPIKRIEPSNTRMALANVVRGKQPKPLRVLLYGVEGVGKSTFAAQAPNPIFLCAEDGTSQLDVARFPSPATWLEVFEALGVLMKEEHEFQTLVIDTLDWLEPLCWAHVCAQNGKGNIEDFGYGKGYVAALDQWRMLVDRLDQLVRTKKMHVILIGHAAVRKIDDPHSGAYDRYRMKLHERAGDLWREWVDAVLFARHEVFTVEKKGKQRGVSSGARVVHTQWNAAFDAKNRFDLPETLPLSWEEFENAVRAHLPATVDKLKKEIAQWMNQLPNNEEREKADKAMREWAGNDPVRLAQLLDRVRAKV